MGAIEKIHEMTEAANSLARTVARESEQQSTGSWAWKSAIEYGQQLATRARFNRVPDDRIAEYQSSMENWAKNVREDLAEMQKIAERLGRAVGAFEHCANHLHAQAKTRRGR